MPQSFAPSQKLLLDAVARPEALAGLSPKQWEVLIGQARRTKLLSRIAVALGEAGLLEALPAPVRGHLIAAKAISKHNAGALRWEANRVMRALLGLDTRVLLLKGGAYEFAKLPPAQGRLASDLDIMVVQEHLDAAHAALLASGWEEMKPDPYDQEYYRRWMHELPPLQHVERASVVDVHHTILPRSSRLRPDPAKLWQAARPLPGGRLFVLCPEDMVLHSATHLFHDGDLRLAIRDLVDLADLLAHFATQAGFWQRLVGRARELDLSRPLFYALRYAERLLALQVPQAVREEIAAAGPSAAVLALMDVLVPLALLPQETGEGSRRSDLALLLLFIRSHWLRMPPALLAKHLAHQVFVRYLAKAEED